MIRPGSPEARGARAPLIWAALALALLIPFAAAAASPLLAWRGPVYIVAGFAGVLGLGMLLVQPLLVGGWLPGLTGYRARRLHRLIGGCLVATVVVHVGGLWITSPPDVIDALLFESPTPFSAWGVVAMWTVFAVGLWAALRRRLRVSPRVWRLGHSAMAVVIVGATAVHALLIEGTMETLSKAALCALVLAATLTVVGGLWLRTKGPAG